MTEVTSPELGPAIAPPELGPAVSSQEVAPAIVTASVDAVPETVAQMPPRQVVIHRLMVVIGVSEATAGAVMAAQCPC